MPAVDEGFRCEITPGHERVLVRLIGELDLATVPRAEEPLHELRAAGAAHLVLDLADVGFMDSSGLRMLIAWSQAAEQDGFRLSIESISPPVRRLLELTGATEYLPISD